MSTTDFSHEPEAGSSVPGNSGTGDSTEQAKRAAGTAKDESKRVAGVATDEAQKVVTEAKNQARGLFDDATSQVEAQSKEQKTKVAETVRTFGDDLSSMTSQGEGSQGLAGQLVQQVADQASSLASHLESREPRELLDDVRSFARRRPGTFLLGALAAGVVVGRLTRGAKAAQDSHTDEGFSSPKAGTPETATPSTLQTHRVQEQPRAGSPLDAPAEPELGAKGVELSESGIVGPNGGRA